MLLDELSFSHKISGPGRVDVTKFIIYATHSLYILCTKFGQDWLWITWEDDENVKLLTHNRRRRNTDCNFFGNLSDSGNLKT